MSALAPIGTRVVGVWGAMFPEWYGTVVSHTVDGEAMIEWDDWCESPGPAPYRLRCAPSVNGSKIGVWTESALRESRGQAPRPAMEALS